MLQDRKSNLLERRGFLSSYEPEEPAARPAARVGADLRAARERLGWTVPAVAAHLRIRRPYLEALEDGRTGDLPGAAYAIGFLRTYAQALGLDADEMCRRFRAEAAEPNRKTELNFPVPVPSRGIPAGAVVLIGCVIAIGGYVAWYRVSEHARPAVETVQPVPDRLASLANPPTATPALPATTPAPAVSAAPGADADAAKAEMPKVDVPAAEPPPASAPTAPLTPAVATVPDAAPPPPGAATQAQDAAAPAGVTAAPAPPAVPTTLASVQAPEGASSPAVDPDGPGQIVLHATADAWVQVRERGGHVLLNRVMRAGDNWPVPDKPNLLLTTGNAAGTQLLLDGQPTASLGADGAVRRDLPLDAADIRAGKLAAAPKRS